jgi:CheY-like chemotaxis protein
MPVMDGIETIGRIRASGADWADVPVIALTADAMRGDREKLLACGMNGYAPKPVNQHGLVGEMIRVLSPTALRERAARPSRTPDPEPVDEPAAPAAMPAAPAAQAHGGPLSHLSEKAFEALKATWTTSVAEQARALIGVLTGPDAEAVEAPSVFRAAHDCKAQARLFGFDLLGEIATSLCARLRGRTDTLTDDERAFAVEHLRNMAAAVAAPATAEAEPVRRTA